MLIVTENLNDLWVGQVKSSRSRDGEEAGGVPNSILSLSPYIYVVLFFILFSERCKPINRIGQCPQVMFWVLPGWRNQSCFKEVQTRVHANLQCQALDKPSPGGKRAPCTLGTERETNPKPKPQEPQGYAPWILTPRGWALPHQPCG